MMGLSIQQFDDLVELWDKEGQRRDIDWLEYAQDFRNRTAKLEARNGRLRENRDYLERIIRAEIVGGKYEALKRRIEEMEKDTWCGHASLYCGYPKRYERLKNYAQHRIGCEMWEGDKPCDCGLDALKEAK